jgi:hypothetical protein
MAYRRSSYARKAYRKPYRKYGSTARKRRYFKKSTTSRKNGSSLQKMIRQEAAKVLRGPRRKVSLVAVPERVPFFSESDLLQYSYFRVPVTQSISLQPGSRNKVFVKGICVRMKISYAQSVAVTGVCYPAKVQTVAIPVESMSVTDGMEMKSFLLGQKDGRSVRLMTLEETNFLHKDGPFAVVPGRGSDEKGSARWELDSNDQTLFTARLAKGAGAPLGKVRWRTEKNGPTKEGTTFHDEFHVNGIMRTLNWGAPGGHVQMDTRNVEVYFLVGKELEFSDSVSGIPVFEPHLELMFGVRAMQVNSMKTHDGQRADIGALEAGTVSDLRVDVYYS